MDWLQELAQNRELPLLSALAIGMLTAIAPCPLATNITATAYIAKTIDSKRKVVLSGVLYTLGRLLSYTLIAAVILFGAIKFHIAKVFQGNGEKFLGPVLIVLGLIMLDLIKINFFKGSSLTDRLSERFKDKGMLGSFFMGALFALAFCPYSGALFFGMLIPLMISSEFGLLVPILFSLGTGLPVIFFAFIIAFSFQKLAIYFNALTKVEKWMRKIAGLAFLATGIYYVFIFFL
ncbi:MAG: aromatic aminobenezylarsenical efflux permease ArsG family transporter [Flavobacterium sp.]